MAKVNKVVAPKSFLLESEGVPPINSSPETPKTSSNIDENLDKTIDNERDLKMTKSEACGDDTGLHRSSLLDIIKAPLLCRNLIIMGYFW